MNVVIAHWDADGVASTSLYFKKFSLENTYNFFSSATKLKTTLCKVIAKLNEFDKLFIFDIAPNDVTIRLASIFNEVVWIDHHQKNIKVEIPKNVTLFINENYKSSARAVCEYFNVNSRILDFIDEIDCNNVVSEEAKFFRDLVSAIKIKYHSRSSKKLLFLSKFLAFYEIQDLIKREEEMLLVENYRKFIENNIEKILSSKKVFEINNKKVLFVETNLQIPVYEIYNKVKEEADLFIAIFRRINIIRGTVSTKIELRSENINVFPIAEYFGGGGHKKAAGASINKFLTIETLINELKKIL
ncbi:MAG: DHHA1 domain-containing protein [Candidatus Aenigmarchaeota archaeon]|nr:DHHA1 domain-containing protein [Candidatus Aenigmarchaeota archaeon]MDW8149600.1 DHHA1 domain-containing protein [Candidatus Aenigmarchaeota archaeon]